MANLITVNRAERDKSFKALPKWAQDMFRHMHAKQFLFEVWSPISDGGRGSWQCMKQPSPTVFHNERFYRLYSRDGQTACLGVSHLHPVNHVKLSDVSLLPNTMAVGYDDSTAYFVNLEITK